MAKLKRVFSAGYEERRCGFWIMHCCCEVWGWCIAVVLVWIRQWKKMKIATAMSLGWSIMEKREMVWRWINDMLLSYCMNRGECDWVGFYSTLPVKCTFFKWVGPLHLIPMKIAFVTSTSLTQVFVKKNKKKFNTCWIQICLQR